MFEVLVKAWIKKGNQYLLAQRGASEAHHAGLWSLPGGKVSPEINEFVVEKTLKKEILEETGIKVEERVELIYNNSFIKTSDGTWVVNLTFLCFWKSGLTKPLEDTAKIKWFTLQGLKSLKNPPDFLQREIEYLEKYLATPRSKRNITA